MTNSQVLPPPVELVKLQLHRQAEWYAGNRRWINISGLSTCLFPTSLALLDPLQGMPAGLRTEVLQGTTPLAEESFVATGSVAFMLEKSSG